MVKPMVTLKLTPAQARVVWATLDGQLDAGACKDGNTEFESNALNEVVGHLYKQLDKWKSERPQ